MTNGFSEFPHHFETILKSLRRANQFWMCFFIHWLFMNLMFSWVRYTFYELLLFVSAQCRKFILKEKKKNIEPHLRHHHRELIRLETSIEMWNMQQRFGMCRRCCHLCMWWLDNFMTCNNHNCSASKSIEHGQYTHTHKLSWEQQK